MKFLNFKISKLPLSVLPLLTLIFGLGIMSGSFAQRTALAGRQDLVPAIQLNNTQKFNGQFIHAVYAIQRVGFIGVTPVPYLEKIRVVTTLKVQSNTLLFDSVVIDKEPFRGSYNIVVFLVSDLPTLQWVNPDQGASTQYQYLTKIEKMNFDAFLSSQGEAAVFGVSL
jgi:hypothetical protein